MKNSSEGNTTSIQLFDQSKLRLGDIVLERGAGIDASITAGVTFGRYSHALIWIGAGDFVEAMPSGVRVLQSVRVPICRLEDWKLLRLRGARSAEAKNAADNARNHVFKLYDMAGALRSPLAPRKSEKADALFCSQLIASAYAKTGIDLVPGKNPSAVTPNDLSRSPLLETVSLPTMPAPDFALAFFEAHGLERSAHYDQSMMAKEKEINSWLYQRASALFQGIKWPGGTPPGNLGELQNILSYVDGPAADKIADQLLSDMRQSGYLELIIGPMNELISSRAVAGHAEQVPSYEISKQRHLENAKACKSAFERHPHPLWKALQDMYLLNAVGFDALIEIASEPLA